MISEPKFRVFHTENTSFCQFAPPSGHCLALTHVKIDNQKRCHCCIRIDVGSRTRFMAYLGREKTPRPEIRIKLPKPIIGRPDESITVDVSDKLPIGITLSGYELPVNDAAV